VLMVISWDWICLHTDLAACMVHMTMANTQVSQHLQVHSASSCAADPVVQLYMLVHTACLPPHTALLTQCGN
jgi:hypothetical protein